MNMARVYNFSAGPSQLPEAVLRRAAAELPEYGGSGQSVMEMSHRSPEYEEIIGGCEALLRQIMSIPEEYKVLFLQGGASTQFAAVPLNLMTKNKKADYVVTGQFAKKAAQEAARFGAARVVASSADRSFAYIPTLSRADFDPQADYVHICLNNTIYGTKWPALPDVGQPPLVADLSSCILSEPFDVSQFGLIYAGAQKNMAPAGLTVVIVREDLLGHASPATPTMLDYKVMAVNDSMYNTPPTYSIYVCKLVLEWIRDEIGGLEKMRERNRAKAELLYGYLDSSRLFSGCADKEFRSMMNVTFVTGVAELDKKFCAEAKEAGFVNLKGHRSVGGMRASIYNAHDLSSIQALVDFMERFEAANYKRG